MKWHNRFMRIAREVSTWSHDTSTKVGAVVVEDKHIMATGYNGVPAQIEDKAEYYQYPLKTHYVIHAEVNAVLNMKDKVNDKTRLYTTHCPCNACAIFLIQAGVKDIVSVVRDDSYSQRWAASTEVSKKLFAEANVTYTEIKDEDSNT